MLEEMHKCVIGTRKTNILTNNFKLKSKKLSHIIKTEHSRTGTFETVNALITILDGGGNYE